MSEEPTALTVEVAAKRLNVGRSTLYAAALKGQVPCIRIGGTVRIPAAWVSRVLTEGYTAPSNLRPIKGGQTA